MSKILGAVQKLANNLLNFIIINSIFFAQLSCKCNRVLLDKTYRNILTLQ